MSAGTYALWGCSNNGNGYDIINNCRVTEYVDRLSRRYHRLCDCPDITPWLPPNDTGVYTNPEVDNAWWFTPNRPESYGFYGFLTTRFEGLHANRIEKSVRIQRNGSCRPSLSYGPTIDQGYEIRVEMMAFGATCCAVTYGLNALKQVLLGCGCGNDCSGTRLRFLSCIPNLDPEPTCDPSYVLPAETTNPWRTLTNAALVEWEVDNNDRPTNPSCGNCKCSNATKLTFTLRANAGLFLDEEEILPPTLLIDDNCVEDCPSEPCVVDNWAQDPNCINTVLPTAPNIIDGCFCPPDTVYRTCERFSIPDGTFPYELEACIEAGSSPLRNLRVRVFREIPGLPLDAPYYSDDCNVCSGFAVAYIPQGGSWCRTACNGVVVRQGTKVARTGSVLLDPFGGPASSCIQLGCGDYVVCVLADINNTAPDATISLDIRQVEP